VAKVHSYSLGQRDLAQAWFKHWDLTTDVVDLGYDKGSLALVTDDGNQFNIQLSDEEVEYRAELAEEQGLLDN